MTRRLRIGTITSIDGIDIHVREDGPADAKAIVLIHGFASSMHWFDRVARLLAEKYHVVRVDLLGHGLSTRVADLEPRSQARAIAPILEKLGLDKVSVAGHSFGADVSLALAERSDLVSEVIIIGQAPDYSYANLPPADLAFALPFFPSLLHRLTPSAAIGLLTQSGFAPGFRMDTAFDSSGQALLDHLAMNPSMYKTVLPERRKRLARRPLDEQLRDLGLPTLVIHGRQDQMYDCAKTVARYEAAGARVEVIEGAGHSPNVERPAAVARIVGDFLSESH